MDQYAYVFMLIFAGVLFLAAASLYFSRDPRNHILFPGGGRKMPKEAALCQARQVAGGVALTALVIAVGSVIGLFRPDFGWWIIIAGVIAAVLYAIRLSRLPSEPSDPSGADDSDDS